MKSFILLGIYLVSFVCIYLMLSLVITVFVDINYFVLLKTAPWAFFYSAVLGWWMSLFPAREYYHRNESELDKIFG